MSDKPKLKPVWNEEVNGFYLDIVKVSDGTRVGNWNPRHGLSFATNPYLGGYDMDRLSEACAVVMGFMIDKRNLRIDYDSIDEFIDLGLSDE